MQLNFDFNFIKCIIVELVIFIKIMNIKMELKCLDQIITSQY